MITEGTGILANRDNSTLGKLEEIGNSMQDVSFSDRTNIETENSLTNEEEYCTEEEFMCDKCECSCNEDTVTLFDNMYLCDECINEHTFICSDCDERQWSEDVHYVTEREICSDCFSDRYCTCDRCEQVIDNDEAYSFEDDNERYCYYCYEELSRSLSIKSYSYKPEPIFYGQKNVMSDEQEKVAELLYGIELEIDNGGKDFSNAYSLMKIINESGTEHVYCKHDGSINNGFELVSHPMTLEYHRTNVLWERVFEKAISLGYRSHMTETCGLHVHVGRKELGVTVIQQEEVIGRVVYFIEKFWDNVLKFSRRTEAQIRKWAGRYGYARENPSDTLKHVKEGCHDRYVCVNLLNQDTIEFRIFRGTLNYSSFIAALEFVDQLCKAAILLSDIEFENMTWVDFVLGIDPTNKKELISYLLKKSLFMGGDK